MIPLAAIERDAVIVACAISAGIHAALAPAHFAEGTGAGLGFAAATAALGAAVAGLTLRPTRGLLLGTAALLGGLLTSYALAVTSGLPLLHPDPEPVDGLALFTKGVEVVGLLAALHQLKGTRHEAPQLPTDSTRADDVDRALQRAGGARRLGRPLRARA